ncbi:MAG: hypothetical protein ABIA62_07715 [Candidatus Woesearchaeota archaeon]
MNLKKTLCGLVAAAFVAGSAVSANAAESSSRYAGIVQMHGVVESGYYVELWKGYESPLKNNLMVLTAIEDEGNGCEIKFFDKESDYQIDTVEIKCKGWLYPEMLSYNMMSDRAVMLDAQDKFEKLMDELRKMGREGQMHKRASEILRR